MNVTKLFIPTIALCVFSTAFDAFFAEDIFHDSDIKISPGFDRIRDKGRTHGFDDYVEFKHETLTCNFNPFEDGTAPNHRLTLTDPMDLQFIIEADYEDPVIFISSKREYHCVQLYFDEQEDFHSTKIWEDMPAGTYLIWVGDSKGETNHYDLIIEED